MSNQTPFAAEARLDRVRVAAGDRIFTQGEVGDAAYILHKGRVVIFQHHEGHRVELGTVGPGEIFGEMAVIDGGRRMASAVAAEDCVLARVPLPVFQKKLDGADRFLRALIQLFIKNIRQSHRIFLRRPRSFRDHVRQMSAFSWNMRRFAGRMDDRRMADDMLDVIERLDAALGDLTRLAEACPDKRHDLIVTDEVDGVDFGDVVGSETRRTL
ncbi:MAG: cyclic nucleotide-binding domain-containing protein [Pseudomonadota bacterium]